MVVFVILVSAVTFGALVHRLDRIAGRLDRLIGLGEEHRDLQRRILGELEHHLTFGGTTSDSGDEDESPEDSI